MRKSEERRKDRAGPVTKGAWGASYPCGGRARRAENTISPVTSLSDMVRPSVTPFNTPASHAVTGGSILGEDVSGRHTMWSPRAVI